MSGVGTAFPKVLYLNPPRCYYITRPLDQSGPRALLIKSPASYEPSPRALQLRQLQLTAPKAKGNRFVRSVSQLRQQGFSVGVASAYSLVGSMSQRRWLGGSIWRVCAYDLGRLDV